MIIHEPTPIPPEWIHRITYCPSAHASSLLDYELDALEVIGWLGQAVSFFQTKNQNPINRKYKSGSGVYGDMAIEHPQTI